jgi:hypothetical protein
MTSTSVYDRLLLTPHDLHISDYDYLLTKAPEKVIIEKGEIYGIMCKHVVIIEGKEVKQECSITLQRSFSKPLERYNPTETVVPGIEDREVFIKLVLRII